MAKCSTHTNTIILEMGRKKKIPQFFLFLLQDRERERDRDEEYTYSLNGSSVIIKSQKRFTFMKHSETIIYTDHLSLDPWIKNKTKKNLQELW